jgi:hypothetical protein
VRVRSDDGYSSLCGGSWNILRKHNFSRGEERLQVRCQARSKTGDAFQRRSNGMKPAGPVKKTTNPKSRSELFSTLTEDKKAEFMAFTMHEAFDDLAGYVARGRKFASLSNDELTPRYVEVFRKVADNPANREHRAIKSYLEAEFQLRNMKVPYELIAEDFERLREFLFKHLNTMKREDPERYAEMNQDIACDFEQFLNARINSN